MTTTVTLHAVLMPPSSQMYIGGENRPIFKGTFEIKLPHIPELPRYMEGVEHVLAGGLNLTVGKVGTSRKNGKNQMTWYCRAHLSRLSKQYFSKLKRAGWVLEKDEALRRGYPNNQKDKKLQEDVIKQTRQNRDLNRLYSSKRKPFGFPKALRKIAMTVI